MHIGLNLHVKPWFECAWKATFQQPMDALVWLAAVWSVEKVGKKYQFMAGKFLRVFSLPWG